MRPLLGLLLWSRILVAQPTLVGSCSPGHTLGGTTAATDNNSMNTTGATLLVASVATYSTSACIPGAMSDNKGNNWHCVANYHASGSVNQALWYAYDSGSGSALVLGPGHWVQFSSNSTYPGIAFMAFANTLTGADPLRSQNGAVGTGSTQTTGAISPFAHDLLISGIEVGGSGGSGFSIDPPFTTGCSEPLFGGQVGAGIAYKLDASSGTQTQVWSNLAGGPNAASIAAFKPASTSCAITTASLPDSMVGMPYSQTISTNGGCFSPNWTVSVGSLPPGLTLHAATGVIDGTPVGSAGQSSFTVSVASSNGNDAKALSINVSIPVPVISAVSLTGHSPSSLKMTWTTDVASSQQIECGTSSGSYTIATPTVCSGSGGSGVCISHAGDGVTAHSMVIGGLAASTRYYCKAVSHQPAGASATSAEFSAATNAPLTSTPIGIASISSYTRYNDQYNGLNGLPNLGIGASGDTFYPMWPGGTTLFGAMNGTSGLVSGGGGYALLPSGGRNIAIFSTSANLFSMSTASTMDAWGTAGQANTNGWTDGATWKSSKGLSFQGNLVLPVQRFTGSGIGSASLVTSSDSGVTWNSPVDGTSPPAGNHAMWFGTGPGQKCGRLFFPQHAQDYGGSSGQFSFANYGDADSRVYFTCMRGDFGTTIVGFFYIEDFLLQDATKAWYWVSGTTPDTAVWTQTLAGANTPLGMCGSDSSSEFIPDFNRYLRVCAAGSPTTDGSAAMYFQESPYIWGPYTNIAVAVRDQTRLNYGPEFSSILASTYTRQTSGPLTATVKVLANGNFHGQFASSPADDMYVPVWAELNLVPAATTPHRSHFSWAGSRTTHIANGLDILWDMAMYAPTDLASGIVPNRSPNDRAGIWNITTGAGHPFYDQHGMIDFGWWTGFPGGGGCTPGCDHPQAYSVATPYSNANTALTLAIVFAHYPNSLAIVPDECVLDKGDISLCRNGSAPDSWTVKVGTTTVGPFSLTTDVAAGATAWPGLFLRWDGNNITVLGSAGATVPLTTLGAGSYSGTLGTSALTLGSQIGGTQPFHGTLAELLVWNRALSDSEIVSEAGAIRYHMGLRGLILP
jgi:hypothetical protein